jgi:ATP-binding cassette, subfamily G (WHITE), member 2, PDR
MPHSALPKFWDFMYRCSPGTYLISGIMSSAVAGSEVKCANNEVLHVIPPGALSCESYMGPFVDYVGGYLLNSTSDSCGYCPLATTDEYLDHFEIYYKDRWRNFGLLWVYIIFNIAAALALYWVFRVPKGNGVKRRVGK